MYDIIIQNNTTRQVFLIRAENTSDDARYLQFEDIDIPSEAKDGEYTYAVIRNDRGDVEYEYNNVLIDSTVKTGDGDIKLKYLSPITGLLRIGEMEDKNTYRRNNKIVYYED